MTDLVSYARRETAAQADTDGNREWALRVASMAKDRWRGGGVPNLAGVLASHPALKNHRTIVLELGYEEYCMRRKAGEALDVDEFSRRFDSFERSLNVFITVQSVVEREAAKGELPGPAAWPQAGGQLLGFDLLCELGRGAVGRVFLASERALGQRRVALKVALHGGHEGEILGRLRHANIVPIHSIQEDPATGLTAFCMPYLGQATLHAVLDGMYADHRPPRQARAILDAILAANQGAALPESPPPDRMLRSALRWSRA